jgi:cytochrome c biogenesis protein CcmG, thiol:disulfide interchange protein DsbE
VRALLVLVVAGLAIAGCTEAIAGCTGAPPHPAPTGPAAAPCVPMASTARTGAPTATGLPDLTLPCLVGGQVRLGQLPGPAIVNLWASWCEPCRTEMPAIQRYAAANIGRVTVLGVDTQDQAAAARSVVADLGIGYPNLYDPGKRLLAALGYANMPVTVFIDATGAIRHVYNQGQPLTEQSLGRLATRYLGS